MEFPYDKDGFEPTLRRVIDFSAYITALLALAFIFNLLRSLSLATFVLRPQTRRQRQNKLIRSVIDESSLLRRLTIIHRWATRSIVTSELTPQRMPALYVWKSLPEANRISLEMNCIQELNLTCGAVCQCGMFSNFIKFEGWTNCSQFQLRLFNHHAKWNYRWYLN